MRKAVEDEEKKEPGKDRENPAKAKRSIHMQKEFKVLVGAVSWMHLKLTKQAR
jgi:hypothetical protein